MAGCQRATDYLHHVVSQPPDTLNFTHKLKELQGESRVDILWVIDNSGSMGSHQQAVIRNANLFIQEFVKNQSVLDWKIGLISTDEYEKPYLGFAAGMELDKSTANPVSTFAAGVNLLGIYGSGIEKPFLCAQRALQNHPNFLRKGAILALILVTDAEEQSSISGADFVTFLAQQKAGSLKQVVYYGVLGPTDWGCPASDSTWNFPNSPYEVVRQAVGGKDFPLCSPSFGTNLADMGKDLVKRITSPKIALTKRPQIGTLRVSWRGTDLKAGPKADGGFWSYDFDLNAIVFPDLDFAVGEDEEVVISYEEAL
jgi:hypothetical protein